MTRLRSRAVLLLPAIAGLVAVSAACGPDAKKGIPITGTLNAASGSSVPLTLAVGEVFGPGFELDSVLDGVAIAGTSNWACYAPLPPDFPNFDIEAFDEAGTFAFLLSINPAVWSSGAHAIDGDDIRLLVSGEDRYGVASSGTVTFTEAGEAPDTAGNNCAFSIAGSIALEGEKDR